MAHQANDGHAVLDRPDGEALILPVFDQGLDVFGFQGSCLHVAIAHGMQFIGGLCEDPFPVSLRGITALAAVCTELFELPVQVFHRVLLVC